MKIKYVYLSLFFEISGFFIFIKLNNFYGLCIYLLIHAFFSFFITFFLSFFIRKLSKINVFYVLFFLIFITSIFGVFFALFLYFYLKHYSLKNKAELKFLDTSEIYNNISPAKTKFGEGALKNIMSASDKLKEHILYYLKNNNLANKGVLLKEALSDDNDEIRLLAFSLLSKEEDKINKLISDKLNELRKYQKFEIYLDLGKLYWEMIYLAITDENLKHYYLNLSKKYFLKALEFNTGSLEVAFYLGRIFLFEKHFKKAKEMFLKSLKWNKNKAIPYLAEIYYNEKNFQKTEEIMNQLNLYSLHQNFYFHYKLWIKNE